MTPEAQAAKQTQDRKYAEERFAWPGGYEMFTVQDDGGTLCAPCVLENWLEVTESDGRDGWGIVGWSHTGAEDGPVACDHCGRVILEAECECAGTCDGPARCECSCHLEAAG